MDTLYKGDDDDDDDDDNSLCLRTVLTAWWPVTKTDQVCAI